MAKTRKPLLVFDSGVGGLSVLAEIRRKLPDAPVVYCADNGGFPYGTKTEAELSARVPALLGRLVERFDPELVVIACNTACTIALSQVRAVLNVPVVGTVPAVKPAAAISKSRVIGVLGTNATVRQAYVDNLVAEFARDCLVLRHGSAELVVLAERKLRGQPTSPEEYRAVLDGLLSQPGAERLDTIVLACTHFPLVKDELAAVAPRPFNWVDSGEGIARRVAHLCEGVEWEGEPSGLAVFTRADEDVHFLTSALHSYGLDRVVTL
ncbi:glutamate racemase [Sphingosinicellaceae bacterium A1X5R2]|nr:glutamate racemase [Pedomonas mirosovicensis]MCH8685466.1 glutamate racemase [Pedomonas mirosovicensis]